ncbi:hypothetical protein U1Q18_048701 [Sarracenia purpurea var. burkii]
MDDRRSWNRIPTDESKLWKLIGKGVDLLQWLSLQESSYWRPTEFRARPTDLCLYEVRGCAPVRIIGLSLSLSLSTIAGTSIFKRLAMHLCHLDPWRTLGLKG